MEFRDAHITFVCEETGETLRMAVESAGMEPKSRVRRILNNPPDFDDMFKDKKQIAFKLKGGKHT